MNGLHVIEIVLVVAAALYGRWCFRKHDEQVRAGDATVMMSREDYESLCNHVYDQAQDLS